MMHAMIHPLLRPATAIAKDIREGVLTSEETVRAHLARIDELDEQLHAVVVRLDDEAMDEARACDRERAAGALRGPLHGVPVTVKEQVWVKDTPSTLNSRTFRDWVAPSDAEVVRRLKEAGAVILGKTNVPRNLLDYQVQGELYPEGVNPYAADRSPGGSSGGSAAALATGMAALELGGDMGGSIRIPANFCGVWGLKPTEGSVPGFGAAPVPEGAKGFVFHLAVLGPMARFAEDLAQEWRILQGPGPRDRTVPPIDWRDAPERRLENLRVGWVDAWPGYEPGAAVRGAVSDLADALDRRGCRVQRLTPPDDLHRRSLALWMWLFGIVLSQDVPWPVRSLMKWDIGRTIMKGMTEFRAEYARGFKRDFLNYSQAMGERAQLVQAWEVFLDEVDVLLCPMAHGPAFPRRPIGTPFDIDGRSLLYGDYCWPYVAPANATGHPALNVPLGLDGDGLPVGVQAVGRLWGDAVLLDLARLLDGDLAGFEPPEDRRGGA